MHQVNTVAVVNPSTALHGAKKIADMLKNMKKEKKKSSRSRSRSRNRSRSRSRDRSDRKKKDEPKLGVLDDGTGNMIQLSGGAQRNILMQKLMRSQKTKVVCLRNMIGADEIDDALEAEVTEECSNYGQVHKGMSFWIDYRLGHTYCATMTRSRQVTLHGGFPCCNW